MRKSKNATRAKTLKNNRLTAKQQERVSRFLYVPLPTPPPLFTVAATSLN
jgi:hypothetical protein